jgi:excinuclease UvrABC ATPase subunit
MGRAAQPMNGHWYGGQCPRCRGKGFIEIGFTPNPEAVRIFKEKYG